jgi:hypothetical protein
MQKLNVVFSIRSDYARHKRQTWKQRGVIKGSGPVIKGSAVQLSSEGKDSSGVGQDRRLKRTAVIREETWTGGVASSRRKIYQLVVL